MTTNIETNTGPVPRSRRRGLFATWVDAGGAFSAMLNAVLLALLLAIAAAWPTASAEAKVVAEVAEDLAENFTDDPTAQKEIGKAVEALADTLPGAPRAIKELTGKLPKGTVRPARGISGPFVELVVNADELACAAWIISYRQWLQGLIIKKDPPTSPQTLQAAQNLYNKVIFACRKVIDKETYAQLGEAPGTETDPEPESGEGDSGSAVDIRFRDGVLILTVPDAICAKQCDKEWRAWRSAVRTRATTEKRITFAQDRVNDLTNSLIPGSERRLALWEQQLKEMKAKLPPYPRSNPPLNVAIGKKEVNIANLRRDIEKFKKEKAALEKEIKALQKKLPELVAHEKATLQAYLECLKKCKKMADSAGDSSAFVDKTIGRLESRLQLMNSVRPAPASPTGPANGGGRSGNSTQQSGSNGTKVGMVAPGHVVPVPSADEADAQLAAIGAIRQGLATRQGSFGQQPPIPDYQDPSAQVAYDVDQRLNDIGGHGYASDYGAQQQAVTEYAGYPQTDAAHSSYPVAQEETGMDGYPESQPAVNAELEVDGKLGPMVLNIPSSAGSGSASHEGAEGVETMPSGDYAHEPRSSTPQMYQIDPPVLIIPVGGPRGS